MAGRILAAVAAVLAAVLAAAALPAAAARSAPASPPAAAARSAAGPTPSPAAVAFVVALRTFEQRDVVLANQAAAQSDRPSVRAAGAALAGHGNAVSARLWDLLDRWQVPGVSRLPPAPAGPGGATPEAALHHACGLVANDELGVLSTLTGPAFDQRFGADWVVHAQSALTALAPGPFPSGLGPAPGLAPVLAAARRALDLDVATLAAALR